ncbi:MAG: M20 family metallopeptidase [Chloroflexaceae bacterium]|nr:M20 family metallopeptidase [Chloroflexaceae bacterium]
MPLPIREEIIRLTSDLIRFDSTADRPDQLHAVIDYVDGYLQAVPGLIIHRSEAQGKPSLVATLRPTQTPTLFLNGHLDVVAAQAQQFEPTLQGDRLYGRGSQDMKGSVAVLMRLAHDLASLETPPNVGFQFVSDEEIGGDAGTGRLLAEGWRCGCFIAAEPTDMRICNEQKGIVWLRLRIPGAAAHGSRPWEGQNPLFALAHGLVELMRRFPPPQQEAWITTVTPTSVKTSSSTNNQIPPDALVSLDIRHVAEDTPESVSAAVQESFAQSEIITHKTAGAMITHADEPLIALLAQTCATIRGTPATFYREHFGSDARFYSLAGIPSVCFGPVGHGLHSDDEWVSIESLEQFYHVLYTYSQALPKG